MRGDGNDLDFGSSYRLSVENDWTNGLTSRSVCFANLLSQYVRVDKHLASASARAVVVAAVVIRLVIGLFCCRVVQGAADGEEQFVESSGPCAGLVLNNAHEQHSAIVISHH